MVSFLSTGTQRKLCESALGFGMPAVSREADNIVCAVLTDVRQLLNLYASCSSGTEVVAVQNSWLASEREAPQASPSPAGNT